MEELPKDSASLAELACLNRLSASGMPSARPSQCANRRNSKQKRPRSVRIERAPPSPTAPNCFFPPTDSPSFPLRRLPTTSAGKQKRAPRTGSMNWRRLLRVLIENAPIASRAKLGLRECSAGNPPRASALPAELACLKRRRASGIKSAKLALDVARDCTAMAAADPLKESASLARMDSSSRPQPQGLLPATFPKTGI